MTFYKRVFFNYTRYISSDLSIGCHWCWRGRLDIHFLVWMFSIGNVPLYKHRDGKIFAVSNSYHDAKVNHKIKLPAFRAGVPDENSIA